MRLNTSQTLALNLDSHIVIDAGAGTGKTSTIIERVIEHYLTEDQRATRILPVPERPADLSGGMLSATPSERVDLRDWGGLLPGEVVLITFTNRASDEIKDRLRKKIWYVAPLTSSLFGSIADTFLFFSIAFYSTGIPWLTLALGDLAVKLFITTVMLIPFRLLLSKIKEYTENSVYKA